MAHYFSALTSRAISEASGPCCYLKFVFDPNISTEIIDVPIHQ